MWGFYIKLTFGPKTYDKSTHYDENIEQEVIVSFSGVATYGILESVKDGLIPLNPCLVNHPSNDYETSNYKLMDSPAVFPVSQSALLPLEKGSIDEILENQENDSVNGNKK